MTRNTRHGVSLACVFVAVATLAGQEIPAPREAQAPSAEPARPLTLADAVARALTTDPELAAVRAGHLAARAGVAGARRWDDPVLAVEGARHDEPHDAPWRTRVAVSQRLVLSGVRNAGVAAFQAEAATAEALIAVRRLEIAREVRDLAVIVHGANLRARALADDHLVVSRFAALVRDRVAAGNGTTSDLLLAQLDEYESAGRVALLAQEALAARARLARRIGITAEDIAEIIVEPAAIPDRSGAIAAASRHPSVQAATREVEARRAATHGAGAVAIPELHLGVFAERDGDADEVGVSVEVPIPAWNRQHAGRAGAAARLQAAVADLAAVKRRAETEAEAAWYAFDAARMRAELLDQRLIPVVSEARRLAEADWAAGTRTLDTVLSAQRTLSRLRAEQADALVAKELARNALAAATAIPVETP